MRKQRTVPAKMRRRREAQNGTGHDHDGDAATARRRYRGGPFDPSYFKEMALALLIGAVWKLVVLFGPGEPLATVGADVLAVATVLVWEVLARTRRMDRLEPPLWLVGAFGFVAVGLLSTGGAFHIANGQPSSRAEIDRVSPWGDTCIHQRTCMRYRVHAIPGGTKMDLGHPLSSVAGVLDARVIETLAGTSQSLSGRDVARLSECSANGVWKSLRRLCGEGIVLADARPGVTLYAANRDHLAWPALEELTRLRATLTERIAEEARGWTIGPLLVSLFGSTARGDAGRESDVDLLVLRPSDLDTAQAERWEDQLSVLRDHIRRWTGNNAQTFQIDLHRLLEHVRAGDPIVASWLADEIRLVGPGIRHFVEAAG